MCDKCPVWIYETAKQVDLLTRAAEIRAQFQDAIRDIFLSAPPEEARTWSPTLYKYGGRDASGQEFEVLRDHLTVTEKLFVLAIVRDHCIPTDRLDPFGFPNEIAFGDFGPAKPDHERGPLPGYSDEDQIEAFCEITRALRYYGAYCSCLTEIANSGESTLLRYLADVEEHFQQREEAEKGAISAPGSTLSAKSKKSTQKGDGRNGKDFDSSAKVQQEQIAALAIAGESALIIAGLATSAELSPDEKMRRIIVIAKSATSWDSQKWGDVLGISAGRVRQLTTWKELRHAERKSD